MLKLIICVVIIQTRSYTVLILECEHCTYIYLLCRYMFTQNIPFAFTNRNQLITKTKHVRLLHYIDFCILVTQIIHNCKQTTYALLLYIHYGTSYGSSFEALSMLYMSLRNNINCRCCSFLDQIKRYIIILYHIHRYLLCIIHIYRKTGGWMEMSAWMEILYSHFLNKNIYYIAKYLSYFINCHI